MHKPCTCAAENESCQCDESQTHRADQKDYSKYFQKPSIKDARKRSKDQVSFDNFATAEKMKDIGASRKYMIKTYGCQMNDNDSASISGILEELGYVETGDETAADIIILNTCAIRENAENRVFGELGRLKPLTRENPDMILGVCGLYVAGGIGR